MLRTVSLAIALVCAVLTAPAAADPPDPAARRPAPPRVSYLDGDVSFWREGAEDWAPAKRNTPIAEGDALYAAPNANLEVQIGTDAFVRIGDDTDLTFGQIERDYLQVRVKGGHAALDLRQLPRGRRIELATPTAAFTVDDPGYYRVDIGPDRTRFAVRGGTATATPPGGEAVDVPSNSEIVFEGQGDVPGAVREAADVDDWDRWNQERSQRTSRPAPSARYIPEGVYGADDLDEHGTWREEPRYGHVWVPSSLTPGWAPYTTGRWVWDPYYGWTWVDDAPWGWAPYHYGRWVFTGGSWGWSPGPVIAAPIYSPALVAFFGSPGLSVGVSIGGPAVGWVALGWGEPLIPWWGHRGFVGEPCWWGWGGQRVVNNIVVQRNTYIRAQNVTIYQNARVPNAMVATERHHFGRGNWQRMSLSRSESQALKPVHGRLDARPAPESFVPATGKGRRPPEWSQHRSVVATRAGGPRPAPDQRSGGRGAAEAQGPRLVPAPQGRAGRHEEAGGTWRNGQRGGGRLEPQRTERATRPERHDAPRAEVRPERVHPSRPQDRGTWGSTGQPAQPGRRETPPSPRLQPSDRRPRELRPDSPPPPRLQQPQHESRTGRPSRQPAYEAPRSESVPQPRPEAAPPRHGGRHHDVERKGPSQGPTAPRQPQGGAWQQMQRHPDQPRLVAQADRAGARHRRLRD
ncbi:MAG: DUF6600 domain-containing protein [Candidatus Binatia bacterium]